MNKLNFVFTTPHTNTATRRDVTTLTHSPPATPPAPTHLFPLPLLFLLLLLADFGDVIIEVCLPVSHLLYIFETLISAVLAREVHER